MKDLLDLLNQQSYLHELFSDKIQDFLSQNDFNTKKCIGQAYDGTSVMWGHMNLCQGGF